MHPIVRVAALAVAISPAAAAVTAGNVCAPSPQAAETTLGDANAAGKPEPAPPPVSYRRELFDRRSVVISSGLLAAVPVAGYAFWWRGHDFTKFKVEREGWFGRNEYSGGADKAGHLYTSVMAGDLMERFYERLGHSPTDARWLAIGVVTIGGLIVEAGDGVKYGGASLEDAAVNVAGGIIGAEIARRGGENLLGVRYGPASKSRQPDDGPPLEHYSREVYTIDFKLAGLTDTRLARTPAKFFMVSLNYGSRGYRELPADQRERNVGLELGLNIPEIMRTAGVPERGAWSFAYTVFRFIRLPFTAVGYHFDVDHRKWHGPVSR